MSDQENLTQENIEAVEAPMSADKAAKETAEAVEVAEVAEAPKPETPKLEAKKAKRRRKGKKDKAKKRRKGLTRSQSIKLLQALLALLLITMIGFAAFLRWDYLKRPGLINPETIQATERGTNHITLKWKDVRNTDVYDLFYRNAEKKGAKWKKVEVEAREATGENSQADGGQTDGQTEDSRAAEGSGDESRNRMASGTVRNLKQGTRYEFALQPHNSDKDGIKTDSVVFATRTAQVIKGSRHLTKMTSSKAFKLDATARTKMSYTSSSKKVATINKTSGKVKIKGAGVTTITVRAQESEDYTAATATIKLRVLDMEGTYGGSERIVYTLDTGNCTAVASLYGDGGVHVPQAIAYTGKKYIVAYCNGKGSTNTRIITFDKKGNKLAVDSCSWNHPNGFTYCEKTKLCYALRGNSAEVYVYNPKTREFGTTYMSYGAAGIAYDPALELIYTTSQTGVRTYSGDGNFSHQQLMSNCSHSGYTYTQDCGAYNGLVFRCMSGSSKHGLNYVDIYDTRTSEYLGSFAAYLGELESAFVNENGDLMILANNSSRTDYIWNTHINVKSLSE